MDGSKSCIFISLKYILIITLVINLINLIVGIPTGLTTIEESEKTSDPSKSSSRKVWLIVTLASNLVVVVLGLVGIAKENFCLSITMAILMTFESIGSFFAESSPANTLTIIFNIIITVLTYVFAFLARSRNVVTHSQVEPATANSMPTALATVA